MAPLPRVTVDLASDRPVPVPQIAPPALEVQVKGRYRSVVVPARGNWSTPLVGQLLGAGGAPLLDFTAAGIALPTNGQDDGPAPDALRIAAPPELGVRGWRRALALAADADIAILDLDGALAGEREHDLRAFAAERVGLVRGRAVPADHVQPLTLFDRRHPPEPAAAAYFLIRGAALRELGHIPDLACRLGGAAVEAWIAQRLLTSGWVVGEQHVSQPRRPRGRLRRVLAGGIGRGYVTATEASFATAIRGALPRDRTRRQLAMAGLHAAGLMLAATSRLPGSR